MRNIINSVGEKPNASCCQILTPSMWKGTGNTNLQYSETFNYTIPCSSTFFNHQLHQYQNSNLFNEGVSTDTCKTVYLQVLMTVIRLKEVNKAMSVLQGMFAFRMLSHDLIIWVMTVMDPVI